MSKIVLAGFLICVTVFVSHDFELGRNVSCDKLTVSFTRGYFF